MFNRSKNTNRYHNYIIVSEKDTGAKQVQFSHKKLLSISSIAIILISFVLFLSVDTLTNFLYKNKMNDLKANYNHLSQTLLTLQSQLQDVSSQMGSIENKDQAIRTYAGLPQIDKDVRQLGVGGANFSNSINLDDVPIDITSRISEIEMNVNSISRKVKLELNSYNNLYDMVKKHSDNLKVIPSIPPVQEGYINSGFGYRKDPFDGNVRFHYGLDFAVNVGTNIYAPADGKIKFVGNQGGFGKVLKIDHGNGNRTLFAHLSKIKVDLGSSVKRGDLVAISGNTGRSAGPHLHYEVHKYGAPQNPLDYFFSGYLK